MEIRSMEMAAIQIVELKQAGFAQVEVHYKKILALINAGMA